jgi:hypothetical protein
MLVFLLVTVWSWFSGGTRGAVSSIEGLRQVNVHGEI